MTERLSPRRVDVSSGPLTVGCLELSTGDFRPVIDGAPRHDRAFVLLHSEGWPVGVEVLPLIDGEPPEHVASELSGEIARDASERATHIEGVSVVLCTRDRAELATRAVARLLQLETPVPVELVVVDNAPTSDATRRAMAEFGDKIRYVVEDRPGLSAARNAGLRSAAFPYVAFTDDDVIPDKAWIHALAGTLSTHAGCVCVTGSVLPLSLQTEAELLFQEFGGYGPSNSAGFEETSFHMSLDPAPSPVFPFHPRLLGTGANMAFRRETLLSIGGFDTALGAGTPARGGEDIDVAIRLILAGHLLVRQPAAVIWHQSHPDMQSLERQLEDYGCGLAAVATKLASQRSTAAAIARRAPAAISMLFGGSSSRNAARSASFPASLRRAEWRGLRRGPAAYWSSTRARRAAPERVA